MLSYSASLNPSRVCKKLCSSPAVRLGITTQLSEEAIAPYMRRLDHQEKPLHFQIQFRKCVRRSVLKKRNAETGQKSIDTIKNQEPELVCLSLLRVYISLKVITELFWSTEYTGRFVVGLVTSLSTHFKMGRELHLHGWRDPGNSKGSPQTVCKT